MRFTLIQNILSTLPDYYVVPRIFRFKLEHIQRDSFVWVLEEKLHLVKCVTVCLDQGKGGLRVRCLSLLKKALLCMWS